MHLAPITLFVYNRLEHTKKTIDALASNFLAIDSELIIFSDGPKTEIDKSTILLLRNYLRSLQGFKKITIHERTFNFGLSNNIIDGVTKVCNDYGKIIVLEDDLITGPFFLTFMNEGLSKYQHTQNVCSIHGYIYPTNEELPYNFFLKGADCWGWATWKRSWDNFNQDGTFLYEQIKSLNLKREFNFNNTYDYFKMLENQILGLNNSWAIRWYASMFLQNHLTLYPGKSLVNNIGFDNSGTHSDSNKIFDVSICKHKIEIVNIEIIHSNYVYEIFSRYFKKQFKFNIIKKVKRKFLKYFKLTKS